LPYITALHLLSGMAMHPLIASRVANLVTDLLYSNNLVPMPLAL
jgi:hypothetical protein